MFSNKDKEDGLDDGLTEEQRKRRAKYYFLYTCVKITVLFVIWLFFTIFLILRTPHETESLTVSVEPNKSYAADIKKHLPRDVLELELNGRIDEDLNENPSFAKEDASSVVVWLQHAEINSKEVVWKGSEWKVYLLEKETRHTTMARHLLKVTEEAPSDCILQMVMITTGSSPVSLLIFLDTAPIDKDHGVIYSFALLIFLYVLIIWDITDRTIAALITSTAAIGVLALMEARPSLETLILWIDIDTLMLLFGMMVMVAILSETGVFDYIAVLAYRYSKGHAWLLIWFLSAFTALTSAFLDNVTMVLLMVPVTIRLCEVMGLHTVFILIIVVVFSNIGGTLTPVGDPPNVIIATDPFVESHGIDFFGFTVHMLPGVFLSTIVTFAFLYCILKKKIHLSEDDAAARAIKVLRMEMEKVVAATALEDQLRSDIEKRIEELKEQARKNRDSNFLKPVPNYIDTLAELEVKYQIRDVPLLIKSSISLTFAVLLFFLHSLPFMKGAKLPWIAVLAALLLLILANIEDLQIILLKVEWATLIFFAALFILMEAFSEMGLIEWIGDRTVSLILSVDKDRQLIAAVSLLLWISAITSAFVDNIPITTMMLRLTIQLARNKTLNLPFPPLVWALANGACLGGNGTLIGASANVVTAGLASQHGYKISFMDFFKIGFPAMFLTVFVTWIYLLIAHGAFSWH